MRIYIYMYIYIYIYIYISPGEVQLLLRDVGPAREVADEHLLLLLLLL